MSELIKWNVRNEFVNDLIQKLRGLGYEGYDTESFEDYDFTDDPIEVVARWFAQIGAERDRKNFRAGMERACQLLRSGLYHDVINSDIEFEDEFLHREIRKKNMRNFLEIPVFIGRSPIDFHSDTVKVSGCVIAVKPGLYHPEKNYRCAVLVFDTGFEVCSLWNYEDETEPWRTIDTERVNQSQFDSDGANL